MNEFLKELRELMKKHEAEIHHEFYGIMLYVGDDEIEIGNIINDLSLKDIIFKLEVDNEIKERSRNE